jgi:hypothetical protein
MGIHRNFCLFAWTILALCFLGCNSKGVTKLADGFQSYETPSAVRDRLRQADLYKGWKEVEQGTSPSDQRSSYKFLTMTGPFKLWGIQGDLTLVFYNNRLMATEFLTSHGPEISAVMHQQGEPVPDKPRTEVNLDRRTRFRYDLDSTGDFRFSWRDSKLEDEWHNWVRNNT